jgi:hypothetical protein
VAQGDNLSGRAELVAPAKTVELTYVHSQAFSALYPTTKGGAKSKRCGDFLEEFATRRTWHMATQFVIQIADNNKELLLALAAVDLFARIFKDGLP